MRRLMRKVVDIRVLVSSCRKWSIVELDKRLLVRIYPFSLAVRLVGFPLPDDDA